MPGSDDQYDQVHTFSQDHAGKSKTTKPAVRELGRDGAPVRLFVGDERDETQVRTPPAGVVYTFINQQGNPRVIDSTGAISSPVDGQGISPDSIGTSGSANDIQLVDPNDGADAFNAAVDALPVAGGTILLTEGTATWNSAGVLDKVGLTVIGLGRAPTHLKSNGGDVFDVQSDHCTITGIRFTGDRSTGTHSAIKVDAGRFNAYDCRIEEFGKGIRVTSGVFQFLHDITMRNHATAAVEADGGNDLYLSRVTYDTDTGSFAEPTGGGLSIVDMRAVVASDCDFIRAGSGLLLQPTSGNTTGDHQIDNCYFDTCATAGLGDGGAGTVESAYFHNCWFTTNDRGILLDDTITIQGLVFDDCEFHNNTNEAARVTNSNTKFLKFAGGQVAGNVTGGGLGRQMDIQEANTLIVQNMAWGDFFGWSGGADFHLDMGSNVSSGRVSDNVFKPTTDVGIIQDDTGGSVTVEDNTGYVTTNRGTATIGTSSTSVSVSHGLDVTPALEDITVQWGEDPTAVGVDDHWVTSVGSSSFTINVDAQPSATLTVAWHVDTE